VTTFLPADNEGVADVAETAPRGEAALERALRTLVAGIDRLGLKRLDVEEIDGERARSSPLVDAFVRAGFRVGYRGLEVERGDPISGARRDASLEDDPPGGNSDSSEHR
jgi:hypothetical protein